MKKIKMLFVVTLCFCLTGCGNGFAKREYDSDKKIAKTEDRYAKEGSVFNPIEGGYSLTVSKFNGRQTLWSERLEGEQEIDIDFSFSISEGKAKIVHIDADGNVTTVLECTPDTSTEGYVTKEVSLKKGKNRLKIVGYDCVDVELEMLFEVSE